MADSCSDRSAGATGVQDARPPDGGNHYRIAGFAENDVGSLEPGKRADFVVLDRPLFEIEPSEIPKTRVLLTVLDGAVVYRAESGASAE